MAQVLKMRWEGVTPEHYEALRPIANWESDPPEGLIFHVAWFRDGGITIVDLWESSENFDEFFQGRLMPGIKQIGLEGQPALHWFDAYAFFNPAQVATPA